LEVLEDRMVPSTWVVDRLTDANPGGGGEGSGLAGDLRYAISQATDGDTVTFGVTGTISLAAGLPNLSHSITIQGPGANGLRVDGGWYIPYGGHVSISGLSCSGIVNTGTLTVSNCTISHGGGIVNNGTLTLDDSTVSDNRGPIFYYGGGGIANYDRGYLTINGCTISGNDCRIGEVTGTGGGIYNLSYLEITNSTITGNQADVGGGICDGDLGGPWNAFLDINNTTISGNSADRVDGGGGILIVIGGGVSMRNTILAGNYSGSGEDDLSAHGAFYFYSRGHNLIGNSPSGFAFDQTDVRAVDPRLGPLQDNGGPTQTVAPLPGSPALNAGGPVQPGLADQRGVVRTGGVNIGAFQASASAFVLTALASVTAGTPFDLTVRAQDSFGQPAVGYTGTAHLSSSDGQATLPGDYTFTLADGGTHTFHGVALRTAGTWAVTATDAGSLTGSGTVTVRPAAADHILLTVLGSATAGTPFDLVVTVQDAYGNTVTDYAGTVTFRTDDPNGSVPADYTFTADDAGTHTFVGGVTLYADGSRVTATDTQMDSLTGSIIVPLG
jgi:hypothetical protein